MTHYIFFIFILLQQGAKTTSAEGILNISAAVGETAELVCNSKPAHTEELMQTISWYQCRNDHDCEQLLGSVTPDLKCLSSSLKRVSFTDRTSENSRVAMVISDLQEDDAGIYKCVIKNDKQILYTRTVHLYIKQVLGPVDPQMTTTTMKTSGTTLTKVSILVADVVLISIAVAVWLGVLTVMLFLCLYARHFWLKASSQASFRHPEMFQITQTQSETTAEPFSTDHPLQRVRPDSGPQEEEHTYESLSRGTGDTYNTLDISARQQQLNEEIRCFRRTELNIDGDTDD